MRTNIVKLKTPLLIAIMMVFALFPMMGQRAHADKFTKYDIYVGGVQVTSDNMNDVLGDGTVKFTPAKDGDRAKLTLDNARIKAAKIDGWDSAAGIFLGKVKPDHDGEHVGNLLIELTGENRIISPETKEGSESIRGVYGIAAYGDNSEKRVDIHNEKNGSGLKIDLSDIEVERVVGMSFIDVKYVYIDTDLTMDLKGGEIDGQVTEGIDTNMNLDLRGSRAKMDVSGYDARGIVCDGTLNLGASLTIDLNKDKTDSYKVYNTGIQGGGNNDSIVNINGASIKIRSGSGKNNYGISDSTVDLYSGSLIIHMGAAEENSYGLSYLVDGSYGLNVKDPEDDPIKVGRYVEISGHNAAVEHTTIDHEFCKEGVFVNDKPSKEGAFSLPEGKDISEYKYFRIPGELCTLTMHWSSLEGVDIPGQSPVVIEDVPKGMSIYLLLKREGISFEQGIFKKKGYMPMEGGMYAPLTKYKEWLELLGGNNGDIVQLSDQINLLTKIKY